MVIHTTYAVQIITDNWDKVKNDTSQNRVIEYNKATSSGSMEVLTSVKNAEGYVTNYEYSDSECDVSMLSKDMDDDPVTITYKKLTNITYPTGKQTELRYQTMKKNCGLGGVMEIPVCTAKVDYTLKANGRQDVRHQESYSRDMGSSRQSAVYDGYPTFRSIKELPDEFRVHSSSTKYYDKSITYALKQHTQYKRSYNGNWLKESVNDEYEDWFYDDETSHLYNAFTDYTYNNQELLTKEATRVYNDFSTQSGATNTYVETTKQYTYDTGKYGDVLSEKINGDSNYTTTYTYDSTYHIPTTITKKKDASTTLKTTYTLTSDKKSIATATVTENNSTKRKRAYTYDSYGNVISEKRYTGNNSWNDYVEIAYDYNDSRSVTNKLNGVAINKVTVSGVKDADGNLVSGSTAGMVSQSYKYDWFGNPISETDANGQTYQYQYDKINRVTKVTNPNASTIEYTFTVDGDTNDVAVKDANGNTIKYSYDKFGELSAKTDVSNNILLLERNRTKDEILIWEEIDYSTQNGSTKTQVEYNGLGEIVGKKLLDSADNVLSYERIKTEHAVDGNLTKIVDTIYGDTDDENVDKIQYTDIYGNIVKEETVYKDNGVTKTAVTTYTHDYLGNVKTVREPRATDENWSSTQYTAKYDYDVDGNVTKETDINGYTIVNIYDGLGNLTSVKDKNGNITLNTYDNLGRLLKEQIPFQKNGSATVYATNKYYYDGNGNVTKSQTANNAVGSSDSYTKTEYQYNWQNQPVKVKGYDGNDVESCVQYYYDSVGNVLRMYTGDVNNLVINGLDNVSGATDYAVTKYAYDSMNRCISQTDAMGQVTSNTYDINGNLISTTDRNGNILSYAYDGLNNLISKSSNKTADDTYTYAYNKKGLRTSMTGGGVDTTSIYNGLGQLWLYSSIWDT